MHPLQDKQKKTKYTFSPVTCHYFYHFFFIHTLNKQSVGVAMNTMVTGLSNMRSQRVGAESVFFFVCLFSLEGVGGGRTKKPFSADVNQSVAAVVRSGGSGQWVRGWETVGVFKALDWTLDCGQRLRVR